MLASVNRIYVLPSPPIAMHLPREVFKYCHFVTILVHAIKICLIVKYAISEGTLMHKI